MNKARSFSAGTSSGFPLMGIKLSGLQKIMKNDQYSETMTTRAVCNRVIIPSTRRKQSSYIELIQSQVSESTSPTTGNANIFVCHSWESKFSDLIESLKQISTEETFFWIDIICINQNKLSTRQQDWYSETLMTGIKNIGTTVFILSETEGITSLKRTWCLWEIYCTLNTKSKLSILINNKFLDQLYNEFDQTTSKIIDVNVFFSKCSLSTEHQAIIRYVKEEIGQNKFNQMIVRELQFWLERILNEIIEKKEKIPNEIQTQRFSLFLSKTGAYLKNQGKLNESELLFKRAFELNEKRVGPEHADVIPDLAGLASVYQAQGNLLESEQIYRQLIKVQDKELGSSNPEIANSLNNLAGLYRALGKFPESEALFKKSLAIREKCLGHKHPTFATGLNNLAVLYQDQARYSEAEPLFKKSLEIRELAFGGDHQDVAMSLQNLGLLYQDQGDNEKAEHYFIKSFRVYELSFELNHPDAATVCNNLALLYQDQGKFPEAEALHRKSVEIRESTLGQDHPNVATALNNLAVLLRFQGKYEEAGPLYRRSLEIREKSLGKNHPSVATAVNNLALFYETQGKLTEAEALYKKAFLICKENLGVDHPTTLTIKKNLQNIRYDMKPR